MGIVLAEENSGAGGDTSRKTAYEPQRVDINIRVPRDRPTGTVVLRGARLITGPFRRFDIR